MILTYINGRNLATNERIGNETQILTNQIWRGRVEDVQEKTDLFERLNKVNAERYSDNCCCKSEKQLLVAAGDLQRQLDHKITGQLKYAYSDLCAPVPSISPLYCSPFTQYGTGMYAGQAASNWNAVNTAINSACPSCTAQ